MKIAFDPGTHTGIALWHENTIWVDTIYYPEVNDIPEDVWKLVTPAIELVIFENYAGKVISKYGLQTVRIIGGIQALATFHNVPIERHTNFSRRAFIPEAKKLLKARGLKYTDHEVDALAHMLLHLRVKDRKDKIDNIAKLVDLDNIK